MNREQKPAIPSTNSPHDSEAVPSVGPHNRELGEIYQQLYPEMRRPKPNQQAIAAALQAMRRLTMDADTENAVESAADSNTDSKTANSKPFDANPAVICGTCGHENHRSSRFCGACGLKLGESEPAEAPAAAGKHDKPQEGPHTEKHDTAPSPSEDSGEPAAIAAPTSEVHAANPASATHHYHHHYHHHYFQGGQEGVAYAAPRPASAESGREADRLRLAAAAKGEPMGRNEAAVRRLTQEWMLACNTRHLDELLELYAPDAMVLRTNLPAIRGAMALREFFHGALEAGLGEVALDPVRVEIGGDMAHEIGRYTALVPGSAGKRREERGKYLWVFARQLSGDWKLVSECWSSDLTLSAGESDFATTSLPPMKGRK